MIAGMLSMQRYSVRRFANPPVLIASSGEFETSVTAPAQDFRRNGHVIPACPARAVPDVATSRMFRFAPRRHFHESANRGFSDVEIDVWK